MTKAKPSIVILTGAGISAESGLKTFRDSDGLWGEYNIEDVATPDGFKCNPELVHRFYNERRRQLPHVLPNPAHYALAELEQVWPGPFLLVTQNVDDLHERAGSEALLHMHGELLKARCLECGAVSYWTEDITPKSACPACRSKGKLRPHVVWFGEHPLGMTDIPALLNDCDYFVAIGTSANVYPAAGFIYSVGKHCHTVELNLDPSIANCAFSESYQGPATEIVPAWVRKMIALHPC